MPAVISTVFLAGIKFQLKVSHVAEYNPDFRLITQNVINIDGIETFNIAVLQAISHALQSAAGQHEFGVVPAATHESHAVGIAIVQLAAAKDGFILFAFYANRPVDDL